jgi:hypothetical protein
MRGQGNPGDIGTISIFYGQGRFQDYRRISGVNGGISGQWNTDVVYLHDNPPHEELFAELLINYTLLREICQCVSIFGIMRGDGAGGRNPVYCKVHGEATIGKMAMAVIGEVRKRRVSM